MTKSAETTTTANEEKTTEERKSFEDKDSKKAAYENIPDEWKEIKEETVACKSGTKLNVVLSKKLVVIECDETIEEHLDLGDLVHRVNGTAIDSRTQFNDMMKKLAAENQKDYTIKFIRTRITRNMDLAADSPAIPAAEERISGVTYHMGCIVLCPNSSLGMHIKAVNSKIYVSWIDNGFKSLSRRAFTVGDAILRVGKYPVAAVEECRKRITDDLTQLGYAMIVIERAQGPEAVRQVRFALTMDKKVDIDPRLADDAVEIATKELERIRNMKREEPLQPILREARTRTDPSKLTVLPESLEVSISVEASSNPLLMIHAPPLPRYVSKAYDGTTPVAGQVANYTSLSTFQPTENTSGGTPKRATTTTRKSMESPRPRPTTPQKKAGEMSLAQHFIERINRSWRRK